MSKVLETPVHDTTTASGHGYTTSKHLFHNHARPLVPTQWHLSRLSSVVQEVLEMRWTNWLLLNIFKSASLHMQTNFFTGPTKKAPVAVLHCDRN